jgi:hypothetical protein
MQQLSRFRKVQKVVVPCCVPPRSVILTARMKMWHLTELTVAKYCLTLSSEKDKRIYDNYPFWFYFVLLVPFCIIVYMVVRFVCFCLIL